MGKQRQRKILSCLPCRKLKVSCDRRQPCSRCGWRQSPGECIYRTFSRESLDHEKEDFWWIGRHSTCTSNAGFATQFPTADMSVVRNDLPALARLDVPYPEMPRSDPKTLDDGKFLDLRKVPRPLWRSTNQCQTHWKPLLQKVPVEPRPQLSTFPASCN